MGKLVENHRNVNSGTGASSPCNHNNRNYIHYDPERTDYSVTAEELQKLSGAGRNSWRDFCLVATPLSLSTIINAAALYSGQVKFTLTLGVFLNSLIGLVSLGFAVCFGIRWRQSSKAAELISNAIKQKPKVEIRPYFDGDGNACAISSSALSEDSLEH